MDGLMAESTASNHITLDAANPERGENRHIHACTIESYFLRNKDTASHLKNWEKKGLSHMDAIKAAAKDRGMKKSDFYKLLTNDK